MSVFTRDFWLLKENQRDQRLTYKGQISISVIMGVVTSGFISDYSSLSKRIAYQRIGTIGTIAGLTTCKWLKWINE